jgi:molecular chaperone DnaJ
MHGRTYYMILGVPRTESPGGIRSAYRDLARRLHPDVAGQQATRAFQEITEAYEVLSDPQRRREYNDELRRGESGAAVSARPVPAAPTVRGPISIVEPLEGLTIEVVLTPEERRQGCVLPIGVPVFRRCPACGGSGRDWLFPCLACGQQGTIEEEEIVWFRIPSMARPGSTFEMPLRGLGIHNPHLRLHVFVEPDSENERR